MTLPLCRHQEDRRRGIRCLVRFDVDGDRRIAGIDLRDRVQIRNLDVGLNFIEDVDRFFEFDRGRQSGRRSRRNG